MLCLSSPRLICDVSQFLRKRKYSKVLINTKHPVAYSSPLEAMEADLSRSPVQPNQTVVLNRAIARIYARYSKSNRLRAIRRFWVNWVSGWTEAQQQMFLDWIADWREHNEGTGVPKHHAGTCEWILNNPYFTTWRNRDDSGLLFLFGPSGCGKTVLTSFLATTLIREAELCGTKATVITFFCKDDTPSRNREPPLLQF